jgi:hypothetical protein
MADPEAASKPSQNRGARVHGATASEGQVTASVELKDALSEKLGEIVPEEPKKQEIVGVVR